MLFKIPQELLDSLNSTKSSALAIRQSLHEATSIEESLNEDIAVYLPFAEFGSKLYFGVVETATLNPVYQFSLTNYCSLFENIFHKNSSVG
jgi:hypothetical protein